MFTDGPWTVVFDRTAGGKEFGLIVGGDKQTIIAESPNSLDQPTSYKAFRENAPALTAVPELVTALEAYLTAGVGNSTDFVKQGAAYDLAIEALAKARLNAGMIGQQTPSP